MVCPSCSSDDWKLASLVHQQGISRITSHTSGSGLVWTGSEKPAFGMAQSTTRGTQQTAASQAASPPSGFGFTKLLCLGIAICGFIGHSGADDAVFGYSMAALCAVGVPFVVSAEAKSHRKAMTVWRRTRICQRCGTFYLPTADLPYIRRHHR
jgi:hypothetical protein